MRQRRSVAAPLHSNPLATPSGERERGERRHQTPPVSMRQRRHQTSRYPPHPPPVGFVRCENSRVAHRRQLSGCCKPPTVCGYAYASPTAWTSPAADADCVAWSNDPDLLCYACASCKAGVLGGLHEQWRRATIALIFVYVVGCSAFQSEGRGGSLLVIKRL
uniref:Tetraspanin-2 n=1 Tax=Zea mays TaxID=4577 RepID=A0A804NX52_MAIZE